MKRVKYFYALYDEDDYCVGTFNSTKDLSNYLGCTLNSVYSRLTRTRKGYCDNVKTPNGLCRIYIYKG